MLNLLNKDGSYDKEMEILLSQSERIEAKTNRLIEIARKLRAENTRLRRLTHLKPHVRMVKSAYESALTLTALHLAGYRTGRATALEVGGVSERNYFYARALLELAAIFVHGEFTTDDPELIEHNLAVAARCAERDFLLLVRRMPPSRRPRLP
jgi:hypothetical protein